MMNNSCYQLYGVPIYTSDLVPKGVMIPLCKGSRGYVVNNIKDLLEELNRRARNEAINITGKEGQTQNINRILEV